jgi:hypothetical protein
MVLGFAFAERIFPPVIPDAALLAFGSHRSVRDLGDLMYDSLHEIPDSLAFGSTSGMTGERLGSMVLDKGRDS